MQKQNAKALDKHIGKRLRALRQQRKMSLEQLAEILDVTQQQMSRYELGQHRLSAAQLYQLARAFDNNVSWFFQGYRENSEELKRLEVILHENKGAYSTDTKREKEQALLAAWQALPSDLQRERLLALLEAFCFEV